MYTAQMYFVDRNEVQIIENNIKIYPISHNSAIILNPKLEGGCYN